ncbi:MAG: phosphopantetheine-binding protein [Bacteroidota bacterium]|nr:phosphopantetheine-binding protein [Bacteroidota bacterium]
MERTKIHALIVERIKHRLVRMGMEEREVTSDLDLVRSGLLDSLSFVDLIADLEIACGKQVDLENALNNKGATTVKGIIEMFSS